MFQFKSWLTFCPFANFFEARRIAGMFGFQLEMKSSEIDMRFVPGLQDSALESR